MRSYRGRNLHRLRCLPSIPVRTSHTSSPYPHKEPSPRESADSLSSMLSGTFLSFVKKAHEASEILAEAPDAVKIRILLDGFRVLAAPKIRYVRGGSVFSLKMQKMLRDAEKSVASDASCSLRLLR